MKEQQLRENVLKIYRLLACGMIEHGELLETDAVVGSELLQVKVRAHREDHGRLLGKGGATFHAFRTVLGLIGYRAKFAVRLLPLENPIHGERAIFQPPMSPAENWNSDEVKAMLEKVLKILLAYPYTLDTVEDEIEHRTIFILQPDEREQMPLAKHDLLKNLSVIFNAIGNNKGRTIAIQGERPADMETKGVVAEAGKRISPNEKRVH